MSVTKDQFELAFRRHQDEAGCSYDQWDIEVNWINYQEAPEEHWLHDTLKKSTGNSPLKEMQADMDAIAQGGNYE